MLIRPTTTKRDVIHKTNRMYIRNAARGGPSHGHRDLHNKFREDRSSSSRNVLADRQTDTQTDRRADKRVDHNTPHPYRGKVIIIILIKVYMY